jgi:hypothetical protein
MSILNNKIECVKALILKNGYDDFILWLEENKLLDKDEWKAANSLQLKSELIVKTLGKAAESEKLMLLDYEWVILPLEIIKITCVTDREKKEFTFGL